MGGNLTGNGRFVYQIYYDLKSRESLDPGFIPLDNLSNPRPDWYEFWPIRNFLKHNALQENAWYGFLSPKFGQKSGFDSEAVLGLLEQHHESGDVALFSIRPDQLAYFLNPFEQGDVWYPGIQEASQDFL